MGEFWGRLLLKDGDSLMPTEQKIFDILMSNAFDDFYEGNLFEYIKQSKGCKTKVEILNEIAQLFQTGAIINAVP